MKSCTEIREMLSFYLDNELHENERKMVVKHLETCSDCKGELEQLKNVIDSIDEIDEIELPKGYSEILHEKLIKAREEIAPKNASKKINYYKWGSLVAAVTVLFFGVGINVLNHSMQKSQSETAYVKDANLNSVDKTAMGNVNNNIQKSEELAESNIQNSKEIEKIKNVEKKDTRVSNNTSKSMADTAAGSSQATAFKTDIDAIDNTKTDINYDVSSLEDAQGENMDVKMMAALPISQPTTNSTQIIKTYENIELNVQNTQESVSKIIDIVNSKNGKIEERQALRSYTANTDTEGRYFTIEIPKSEYDTVLSEFQKFGAVEKEDTQNNETTLNNKNSETATNEVTVIRLDVNSTEK
jgi:hypothetical protein